MARQEMSPRQRLEVMVRTDRGDQTVWSPGEVHDALDAYRAEAVQDAADKLTIREATPLWDAVNNILLKYGFYNPASSVSETEKIFELFREHLAEQSTR
ncbi:hypothetical protein OG301_39425 (plasmid) [Streptomyces platensis]|uniref:hypothetical protein n=1 Tax=Streptomyces platensis TaxID=58346 RepID=UPI002ED1223E|nr:hypothetical protein OG301_39425 [Streptomyces platensis]